MGALLGGLGLVLALAWGVPLPERLTVTGSPVVQYRDGTPAQVFLAPDDRWRIDVRLSEVDPAYVRALLKLEDRRFWIHPGVDPLAILRAVMTNLARGRVVSGASTLTMQVVRMAEPRPRTLRSKLIEAARAVQLELRLSKTQILETYLRLTPYGRNLEGVEAASLAYFGHRASALSPPEIATLLAVPQDPNDRYPTPGHAATLKAARDLILTRLVDEGLFDDADLEPRPVDLFTTSPVPTSVRAMPRELPHAAPWLRRQHAAQIRLVSAVDRGIQRQVEGLLRREEAHAHASGIHNAAVVVVDHTSAEVVALVGNFDFDDDRHGGQIVGYATPRSVGSTLKPFLYALAIDRGLALPETLVPDVPMRFGAFQPTNFDGGFDGLVTLEDALSRSLNLPFIGLVRTLGIESFLAFLRGLGLRSLRPQPGYYGLSVATGGLELSPLEMAALYTVLAEGGQFRPPRLLLEAGPEPTHSGTQVLSAGATWLTVRALSLRDRPDFPGRRQVARVPPDIHWKTGTSYGHRDAWAAGSNRRYTAVVWMGNFDQTASASLVGAEASGPLLFDLLESLSDPSRPPLPPPAPAELGPIEVCAWSGRQPTTACPSTRVVLARRTAVPVEKCHHHVWADVDDETGLRLSPRCREGRAYHTARFTQLDPTVRRWLADTRRQLPNVPSYAPGCEVEGERRPPRIVSPADGNVLVLVPGLAADAQEVALEADTGAAGAQLSWFVDGRFLGRVAADERVWWVPEPGRHEVVVMDEAGLSSKRTLEVWTAPGAPRDAP